MFYITWTHSQTKRKLMNKQHIETPTLVISTYLSKDQYVDVNTIKHNVIKPLQV